MDLMRYVLAVAVVIAHIGYLTGQDIPFPLSSFEAVGGFFAISGFLMYPNYLRHGNPVGYTKQRARRILPPYMFIVVACAVGLSAVSDLDPSRYFTSGDLFAYLGANLSFLNWLHPDLPGVFQGEGFVTSAVNGSLWTMKVEWCLYFSVPCFIWLAHRLRKVPLPYLALAVIVLSIVYRQIFTTLYISTGSAIYDILRRQIFGQLAYFYCGMLVWFLKDFFTRHIPLFLLLGVALRLLQPLFPPLVAIVVEPFAITAVVLGLSLIPSDIKVLRHRRNISYEIYLFHFPVIQLGVFLGIVSMGTAAMVCWSLIATSLLALAVHIALERCMKRNRH